MSQSIEDVFAQMADPYANPWESVECRNSDPEAWWFADDLHGNITNEDLETIAMAIEICERCPMKDPCLQLGMEKEDIFWGIWGGTFAGERLTMIGRTRGHLEQRMITKARVLRARLARREAKK